MSNELSPVNPSISFAPTVQPQSTQAMAAISREASEVQAAVFMARQFPRDPGRCLQQIEGDCTRITLAEKAIYEYPKGGQTVSGPSIRLAEVVAQRWQNLDTGWKITDRSRNDETGCVAWCWDLETNVRKRIEFVVPHIRSSRKGDTLLTDPREIYELIANQASRRQRNCILAIIPGDVVEAAVIKCNSTIANAGSIEQKRGEIVKALAEFGVVPEAIEKRIGKKISAMSGTQYTQLRNICNSLRDGMSKTSDWFEDILNPEKIKAESDAAANSHELQNEAKARTDGELAELNQAIAKYLDTAKEYESLGGELTGLYLREKVISLKEPARIRAASAALQKIIDKGKAEAAKK